MCPFNGSSVPSSAVLCPYFCVAQLMRQIVNFQYLEFVDQCCFESLWLLFYKLPVHVLSAFSSMQLISLFFYGSDRNFSFTFTLNPFTNFTNSHSAWLMKKSNHLPSSNFATEFKWISPNLQNTSPKDKIRTTWCNWHWNLATVYAKRGVMNISDVKVQRHCYHLIIRRYTSYVVWPLSINTQLTHYKNGSNLLPPSSLSYFFSVKKRWMENIQTSIEDFSFS